MESIKRIFISITGNRNLQGPELSVSHCAMIFFTG